MKEKLLACLSPYWRADCLTQVAQKQTGLFLFLCSLQILSLALLPIRLNQIYITQSGFLGSLLLLVKPDYSPLIRDMSGSQIGGRALIEVLFLIEF
jgi:hypothetical protein